jgi:hypothetical protein
MTPVRAFELLTKLAVPVIAAGGALTLIWLALLLGQPAGQQICNASPQDCRQESGHLPFGLVSCPVALLLALVALPLVVSRWRGRARRQEAWRKPEWWRFGTAAPLLLAAAGLDYVGLRFLTSLGS